MKATELTKGFFESAIFLLTQELGEEGAAVITRIHKDGTFRKRTASYMLAGAPEMSVKIPRTQPTTIEVALGIMRPKRVVGPDDVERILRVTIDTAEKEAAKIVPYKASTLARYAQTHLLVYGYGIELGVITNKVRKANLRASCTPGTLGVIMTSMPSKGWYLLSRKIEAGEVQKGERLATVAELVYGLGLYRNTHTCNNLLFNKGYARCAETEHGGEIYFGLGMAFLGYRYGEGSHDYRVEKEPTTPSPYSIRVVVPDMVPGDPTYIEIARDTLEHARVAVLDPNCHWRYIEGTLEWIEENVKSGKFSYDEVLTSAEEIKGLKEAAFSHREGNWPDSSM